VGYGETPAHALEEHAAIYDGFEISMITSPKAPEGVNQRFTGWKKGTTAWDPANEEAYVGGNATITGGWEDSVTVQFSIYGAVPVDPADADASYVSFTQLAKKGGSLASRQIPDYQQLITDHNTKLNARIIDTQYGITSKDYDEFECWINEATGKVVRPTSAVFEEDTVLVARMDPKIVLDKQDGSVVAVQAHTGDKLGKYKTAIESLGTKYQWVDANGDTIDYATTIINGDMTFYALKAYNTDWTVIQSYPEATNIDPDVAVDAVSGATIEYYGAYADTRKEFEPVVISADNLNLQFRIEAPADVKRTDSYKVSINNGAPTAVVWGEGTTISNNLYTDVTLPLTVDEIKTAVDANTWLYYTFKFTEAGATKATFTVYFMPQNLKITDYDNDLEEFIIRNGKYKWTLTYDTVGGTPAIDPVTAEYGESVELSDVIPTVSDDEVFVAWTGKNTFENEKYEFWMDADGEWQPEASIVMTDNVLLTANYDDVVLSVEIINGKSTKSYLDYSLTDTINSLRRRLEPESVEDMTMLGWKYLEVDGETENWKALDTSSTAELKTIANFDEDEGWYVVIAAQYGPKYRYANYNLPLELEMDPVVK
jgi:hypothetical protein